MKYNAIKVSVIGLGKLGFCTAACLSAGGYQVLGIDTNDSIVRAINNKEAYFPEPGLQELLNNTKGSLTATQNLDAGIFDTDITLIIVPTPSTPKGSFSTLFLENVLVPLAKFYRECKKKFHTFVITSTVSPRTTEEKLIPLFEMQSGKKNNKDFGFCYSPEFISLGNVVKDFLNPDVVVIGESCKKSGTLLEKIYTNICKNKPHISRMSIVSAEITKISLNSFVTSKISFANTLANICENVKGANVDDITEALGADRRISPYYLKAGPSYGGPCFPRDNRAFVAFAKAAKVNAPLAKATERINNFQNLNLIRVIKGNISKDTENIAILGLSYKANTPVIEASASIKVIEQLLKLNLRIKVFDPLAIENTKASFQRKIVYAENAEESIKDADIIIVFDGSLLKFLDLRKVATNKNLILLDCWRCIDPKKLNGNIKYIGLGNYRE